MNKMKKITEKKTFNEIIDKYPFLVDALLEGGMHCIGCPMSRFETLKEGALTHGLNPKKLVEKLNNKIKENE
jgi:hybrid cluster-associated redox disulfide protein